MPAESKAQQRAAAMALAAKRGDISHRKLKGAALEMYKMSTTQLEEFASTKRKKLPAKKKATPKKKAATKKKAKKK